jgi:hypothetical protein
MSEAVQGWNSADTDEIGEDRSHGDRLRESTYCFVSISRCFEYNNPSQETMHENTKWWSSTDVDLCNQGTGVRNSATAALEMMTSHDLKKGLEF